MQWNGRELKEDSILRYVFRGVSTLIRAGDADKDDRHGRTHLQFIQQYPKNSFTAGLLSAN